MRAAVPSHLWVCAAALLAAQSDAGLAVTGGVSADAALGARGGAQYSQQQATAARAVLAVTVPLFNADSGVLCSSTIIHPRVVLTAAHCVVSRRGVSRRIVVRFQRSATERQALDVAHHPAIVRFIQQVLPQPQ